MTLQALVRVLKDAQMKFDVLTLAAVVFLVGVLASSVGASDLFKSESSPPAQLQQGIAIH